MHFTYAGDYAIKDKLYLSAMKYIPFSGNYMNLRTGRKFFAPRMQMNEYNLNRLFFMIQKVSVLSCYIEFTQHGHNLGIIVYFKKPKM